MTATENAVQSESWNGKSGLLWVANADERDRVLAPVGDVLLSTAAPTVGDDILDLGCGCGATTLMAATRTGTAGSATGIDLSLPMLDLARERATAAGAANVTFVHGDAQTYEFTTESVDLVIGRFGTMFFSDPEAAFANIRSALRPGGRLCLATWQPLGANEWLIVPGAALLQHTELPTDQLEGPGMFAQSDPAIVTEVLGAAGFHEIRIDAAEVTFPLGQTLDEAISYLADAGPGRALLETIPEGAARDAALADVRAALVDHHHPEGVQLHGGIWLINAIRPFHETQR